MAPAQIRTLQTLFKLLVFLSSLAAEVPPRFRLFSK